MTIRIPFKAGFTLLALAWLVGCDGEGEEMMMTEPPPPASLTLVSGDGQTALRGSPLDEPFVVRATDASGQPVPEVIVDWILIRGNGEVSDLSSQTDENGEASVRYTVGSTLTLNVVRAVHGELEPVDFHAEAVAAPPAAVAMLAGDGQMARTSQPLADPLVVRVTGTDGLTVPGVEVNWSVTSGGGVLSEGATSTDRAGLASVNFVLGPEAETNVVSATVSGLDDSATFELEATRPVTAVVEMKDAGFVTPDGSDVVTILLGDTVRWTNADTGTVAVIKFGPLFDCTPPLDSSAFIGPDTVAVGQPVEWVAMDHGCGGRIVSSSVPAGGNQFDSGVMEPGDRFQFVPGVAGTWEYSDVMNGGAGTLTAEPDEVPAQHTATSNLPPEGGMPFDSGQLDPGEGFEFLPDVRGTWRYECEVHCSARDNAAACRARILVQ